MGRILYLLVAFVIVNILQTQAQNSWRNVSSAPAFTRIDDIYFTNPTTAYMGQDGKVFKSIDGGENWDQIGTLPNDAYIRSIEFINDSVGFIGTIYDAVGATGFYQTVNAGKTWTRIDDRVTGGMFGICGLDHIGGTIIGVGIYSEPGKFYISRDYGATWKSNTVNEAAALVDCQMLNDSTYIVAGSSYPSRRASIYKTTDYGRTWKEVALSTAPTSYTWKISINENGFGIASIEFSKTSFITNDFGDTWQEVFVQKNAAGNLNLGGAAMANNQLGWLGDQWSAGIFETIDGGQNWNYLDFGASINNIKILGTEKAIAVGRTVYMYDKTILNTSTEQQVSVFHKMQINPNPVNSEFKIKLDLICNTAVRIDLMDEQGNLIRNLTRKSMHIGEHDLHYQTAGINSGVYFIWLRTNEGHLVKKLIISKN